MTTPVWVLENCFQGKLVIFHESFALILLLKSIHSFSLKQNEIEKSHTNSNYGDPEE